MENDLGAEPTVLVQSNKIKLRVYHFSIFDVSYWWNWLWGSNTPQPVLRWVVLSFMQPPNLSTALVFIKVYVVREDQVQVG